MSLFSLYPYSVCILAIMIDTGGQWQVVHLHCTIEVCPRGYLYFKCAPSRYIITDLEAIIISKLDSQICIDDFIKGAKYNHYLTSSTVKFSTCPLGSKS